MPSAMTVQTRSISGELRYYATVIEALTFAKANEGVWKVSFNAQSGERIRLVRSPEGWVYENINDEDRYI